MDINQANIILSESISNSEKSIAIKKLALSILEGRFLPEFQIKDTALSELSKEQDAHQETRTLLADKEKELYILKEKYEIND